MSRMNEREIARKLAEREELEPPAGLLEKIKGEIPPSIPVGTEMPEVETRSPVAPRQRWLMAASVVAMIGAGLLALQRPDAGGPRAGDRRFEVASAEERMSSGGLAGRAASRGADEPAPGSEAVPWNRAGAAPPPPKPLSRKEMDELKSLGYVTRKASKVALRGASRRSRGRSTGGAVGGAGAPRRRPQPPCKRSKFRRARPLRRRRLPLLRPRRKRRAGPMPPPTPRADGQRRGTSRRSPAPSPAASRPGPTRSRTRPPSRLSTFEADSGTASYELVRRSLFAGQAARSGSGPRRGGAERL